MATKKDLVEAYSFSRRRLVTAFVSGAPGGREVEPSRPGRTLIGGVAIAVLVAAGAGIGGLLGSHTSVDWSQAALVSEKDKGALYVNLPAEGQDDAPLRPVVNVTSAMLLLGPDLTHIEVPRSAIGERTPGSRVGILQAPAVPPDPSELIQNGWSACTGGVGSRTGRGVRVDVDDRSDTRAQTGRAALVSSGGRHYLIAEDSVDGSTGPAYAYPVPQTGQSNDLVTDLAGTATATPVDADWLDLFPQGSPLGAPSFAGSGGFPKGVGTTRVSYAAQLGPLGAQRAEVGDYFTSSQSPGVTFVLTKQGAARLQPFAARVYEASTFGGHRPTQLTGTLRPPNGVMSPSILAARDPHWPTTTPSGITPPAEVCAVLDTGDGSAPQVHLATADADDDRSAASGVDAGKTDAYVDPGHGAVVTVVGTDSDTKAPSTSQQVLIDDLGMAYPLVAGARGSSDDAAHQLGYDSVAPVLVPDTWIKLFRGGVPLSVNAARCPPSDDTPTGKDKRPESCAG